MADLYTLRELVGRLAGHTLAWIGDANNVARSLLEGCGKLGMRFVMATPDGIASTPSRSTDCAAHSRPGIGRDRPIPSTAVRDATAVYTDVWASMGQEAEREAPPRGFRPLPGERPLMAHAPKDAYFMHCLPARRGEEVTDEVIDGPQSVVVQQAGNRMHVQKGILWPGCLAAAAENRRRGR